MTGKYIHFDDLVLEWLGCDEGLTWKFDKFSWGPEQQPDAFLLNQKASQGHTRMVRE